MEQYVLMFIMKAAANIGRFFLLADNFLSLIHRFDPSLRTLRTISIYYIMENKIQFRVDSTAMKFLLGNIKNPLIGGALLLIGALAVFGRCAQAGNPLIPERASKDMAMPNTAKPAAGHLTDVSCWTENETFYIAALVDSDDMFWKRFWAELKIVDSQGQLLKVTNDSFALVPTHSYAVPPRGRTSLTWGIALKDIAGTPDSVILNKMMGQDVPAGAILIVSSLSTFKVLSNNADSTSTELGWRVSGTVENPLPFEAAGPCIDLLIYGTDQKLYMTQALELNSDTALVKSQSYGPLFPQDKRAFGLNIVYDGLPQALRDKKIGKVDILGFEKR